MTKNTRLLFNVYAEHLMRCINDEQGLSGQREKNKTIENDMSSGMITIYPGINL